MRENLLEATRRAVDLGRDPTVESLEADFLVGFGRQSTSEAKDPPRIAKFRKIVKTKSFGKVDGTPVDLFSASAVTQVYDALSKPANQKKYAKMDPVEMISIAYKLLQKGRKAATSRETSQAGAGVKNAMAQAVVGRGATRKPLGDVGYAGTQEARKKISPKQIAQGALKAFTKKYGEFNRNNKRHINTLADVLQDEYLAAVRKGLDYPDYKSIEAELYKLTKGPSRFSMGREATGQGKLKLFRKASGNQPDVYQVLNPSGGVEGFIEKQPDTRTEKYPWKAFGRTYGGRPGRGEHLGDFKNKNAAMKAVMKAGG
ncbi:hypothetical protein LCGC14_1887420 [marine sediment metagenome]|uniref:Uncharacterized protein n=1 Tax=marine sediment metagenome TaxID=412755 RepID=A0A0F9IYR1_9ZZZZ